MKARLTSFVLALALVFSFAFAGTASAQPTVVQGAAGLVNLIVGVAADDVVEVNVVDSLNNLTALNNILNNSPILSGNDIDVTVGDISILEDFLNDNTITLTDFLNENEIELEDILQIVVLDTGDILVFI